MKRQIMFNIFNYHLNYYFLLARQETPALARCCRP